MPDALPPPRLTLVRAYLGCGALRGIHVNHPVRRLLPSLLWTALIVGGVAGRAATEPVSAGLLYHQFPLTLDHGIRVEALGPLVATETRWPEDAVPPGTDPLDAEPPVTQIARTFTLAPLFNWNLEPTVENVSWDLAYPVITYDRYGGEYRLQVFQVLGFSGGKTQANAQGRAFTLVPFFWFRRSAEDPSLNYGAVWPFYGYLQKRLFRDETRFLLWPAWVQTRRRDVVTDNYLVPIVHVRRGDGLQGWQVWPFYGTEHKDLTTRTNGFGEVESVPGHDKRFVLWPFYGHNDLDTGSTNPIQQRLLLPFYSLQRSPAKDRDIYGWPFGVTLVRDRELAYDQTSFLWPVFTFAHGEGKQATRVWPLYGTTRFRESHSRFVLWPLYYRKDTQRDPLERHVTRIGFFLYTGFETINHQTGTSSKRADLWPFFISRRDMAGNERFQALSIFSPLLAENVSIRRLYEPLWALWRSEHHAASDTRNQSLLWNLYRRETSPERAKVSLLFGLVQHTADAQGKRWRFLYLPTKKKPRPGPAPHS